MLLLAIDRLLNFLSTFSSSCLNKAVSNLIEHEINIKNLFIGHN